MLQSMGCKQSDMTEWLKWTEFFVGFSRQGYWSGLPFSSPVDHVLSEFSTITHPSWEALQCMAHSFFELDKAVVHVIRLVAAAKSLQSCPTLCDPIDGSQPGFPVPGILQARTLEWVAISFSNAWEWKVKVKSLSRVQLCGTPWTAAYQAPPSMGFSRQEYWSGVPWSDWLVFCECGFQSVCPLMEIDKRLMQASWRERMTEGETGSCSDGRGHAQ